MLVEWTVPDNRKLLWSINLQQEAIQGDHKEASGVLYGDRNRPRVLSTWKHDDGDDDDDNDDKIHAVFISKFFYLFEIRSV